MTIDAAAVDRLPWLADEPSGISRVERHPRRLLLGAAAALGLVAIAGFWITVESANDSDVPAIRHEPASVTIPLPPARTVVSPQVQFPVEKEVRPVSVTKPNQGPASEATIASAAHGKASQHSRHGRQTLSRKSADRHSSNAAATSYSSRSRRVEAERKRPVLAAAAGRQVQIGAFGSIAQARRGWQFMVRQYPAMAGLPIMVRPSRNSKGRVFYRFHLATGSQARSELICQRMEKIKFSCAVKGLPKPKVQP
ncbi:MAG TPA: hypothetical protein VE968_00050 [Sphingomicrobium sp.]|nr:hypothetical protein [Sphingomicrobium sp.]